MTEALSSEQLRGDPEVQATLGTLRDHENFHYTHPRDLVCKRCWESYHGPVKEGYIWGVDLSTTVNDLKESSKLCNLCGLLYVLVLASAISSTSIVSVSAWRTGGGFQTLFVQLQVMPQGRMHSYEFEIFADSDDPISNLVQARDLLLDVASPEAFRQAQGWLTECPSHHHCSKAVDSALPTRVISIPAIGSTERPKLVEGAGKIDRYAALSYCWGPVPQPFMTTSENVEAYMNEIAWSKLPQTITDAIRVAQHLQIPYLWVDSMCILQCSRADKDQEISRLRQYFRGAYVTIIAASAKSSTEGFLGIRPSHSPRVRLPLKEVGVDTPPATVSVRLDRCQYRPSVEPTTSRAWTLEEAVLSPRALIFASNTLQYSCETGTWYARSGLSYGSRQLHPMTLRNAIDGPTAGSTYGEEALASRRVYLRAAWLSLVSDYSGRKMTHAQDRLVALAALAEEFAVVQSQYEPALNLKYLAGFWEHDLLKSLLWHTVDTAKSPRPTMYLGPTWSWASTNGRVVFPSDALHSEAWHCQLVSAMICLATTVLPYGPVTAGEIRIVGLLKELVVTSMHGQIDRYHYLKLLDASRKAEVSGGLILDSLTEEIGASRKVCMLPLSWKDAFLTVDDWLCGIAVVPIGGKHFRRVGFIFTQDEGMFERDRQHDIVVR
ncbi:hypothetical protein LTS15_009445 [Exophiala xenobiotica]|nr:hypothetical protein LTS15_009445 [Exophiala xenobiotica]